MMSVEDVCDRWGLCSSFCCFASSRLDRNLSFISLLFLSALSWSRCVLNALLRRKLGDKELSGHPIVP